MAYNPSLYNPYGLQMQPSFPQPPVQQQSINGLVFIEKSEIDTYQMPPGSVSPPLFVDDSHFAIKSFDSSGGSSVEWYQATKIPATDLIDPHEITVTKADLDAFKLEIMEAINGKHTIQDVPATPATATGAA